MQVWLESQRGVPKRLFILGGTGATGQALIGQALRRGHQVTAFVRSPQKLDAYQDRIQVVTGDPGRSDQLEAAMVNHDAVLSALGHRGFGPSALLHGAAIATVRAMDRNDVRRLVVVSVGLLFHDAGMIASLLRATILRNVAEDSDEMEQIVRQSGMDWTIARPPRLTDGPLTGRIAVADGRLPIDARPSISRADLACFMLNEVDRPAHDHCVVGMGALRERTPAFATSRHAH